MILSNCKVDLRWISDNWQSVLFVCSQPYSKVSILNYFETILQIYSFIAVNIANCRSLDFKSFTVATTINSNTTINETASSSRRIHRSSRQMSSSFNQTLMSRFDLSKSIWKSKPVTTAVDSSRYRPEVVRFIQRALFF